MKNLTGLVFLYFICCAFIGWALVDHFEDKEKQRNALATLFYESGYINGTLSGAKYMQLDSVGWEDWLEMKKQDSIEFDKRFINKE